MSTPSNVHVNLDAIDGICKELNEIALSAAHQGKAIDEVEQEIWEKLIQLGGELVGIVLAQLGRGDVGPEIQVEGKPTLKRSEQPQHRRYRSVFGVFDLERYTYAEQAKRKAQRIPLDEQVGLPEHDYSLLLEKWIGIAASEDSFDHAVSMLERMLLTRIPVDSAERVCGRQAEMVNDFFDQLPTPDPDEEGSILVETVDRKGVPLRRSRRDPQPAFAPSEQKGAKPGTKKMAAVGSVYSVDRHQRDAEEVLDALFRKKREGKRKKKRPRPKHKRVRAMLPKQLDDGDETVTLDTVAVICDWMNEEAESRHRENQEIVLICDGEEGLWETASLSRSESTPRTEILDLLHAVPRIWKCGELLHDNEPLERYVYQRIGDLLAGRGRSVIRGFRRKATLMGLQGKPRETIDTACNYLERHLRRMRYDEYLERGLPIASGVIEGACRHLVKDRLERSGMRWTIAGAQSILDLRSIITSDLWEPYQDHYRARRLRDRYGETRRNFASELGLAA